MTVRFLTTSSNEWGTSSRAASILSCEQEPPAPEELEGLANGLRVLDQLERRQQQCPTDWPLAGADARRFLDKPFSP
jgi:hypothetical protein